MTDLAIPKTIIHLDIIEETAKMFGFKVEAILGSFRWAPLVRARHIAMWRCRHDLGMSYPAITKAFNREDHTTACMRWARSTSSW
jgi:chromosomal replication initiation ATPase DnaA